MKKSYSKYSATFSDGRIIEIAKSTRDYSAAWMAKGTNTLGGSRVWTGFAGTKELAEKAMRSETAAFRNGKWGGRPLSDANKGEITNWEIVDVERVQL